MLPIRAVHFTDEDIDLHTMGAGVVPFAVRPADRMPHLLLGRERFLPQWKGSCRWSGFEGTRKPHEAVATTAVREFREESLGVLSDMESAVAHMTARTFAMRVVIHITTAPRRATRLHCTYVTPVAWDPGIVERFAALRADVEYVERLLQEWLHLRGLVSSSCAVLAPPDTVWGPVARVDGAGVTCQTSSNATVTLDDGPTATFLVEWAALRDKLARALPRVQGHPSVVAHVDDTWGLLQRVEVNVDYLEKDHLRWWSVEELREVFAQQGKHGTHRFRPFFLPVLQTILTHLPRCTHDVPDRCLPTHPAGPDEASSCRAPPPPAACPADA